MSRIRAFASSRTLELYATARLPLLSSTIADSKLQEVVVQFRILQTNQLYTSRNTYLRTRGISTEFPYENKSFFRLTRLTT